jgi:hypothetical protein
MRIIPGLTVLACLALSACTTIREGVVVEKKARAEMPEAYDLYSLSFRYEPGIYWVRVEGKDDRGRERIKNIILFRRDWLQLRLGDHWSRQGGFSPGDGSK